VILRPIYTLHRRQWLERGLHETFEFFERPENLPRITPPRLRFRILTPAPIVMRRGLLLDYQVRVLGRTTHWRSVISEYDPPFSFRDEQLIGPYRLWDHRHRFWRENGGTVIEDFVVYAPPLGPIGALLDHLFIRRQLRHIFDFRREQIERLLREAPSRATAP
jgi:ligand-binding SRPBCC domain-containing protein